MTYSDLILPVLNKVADLTASAEVLQEELTKAITDNVLATYPHYRHEILMGVVGSRVFYYPVHTICEVYLPIGKHAICLPDCQITMYFTQSSISALTPSQRRVRDNMTDKTTYRFNRSYVDKQLYLKHGEIVFKKLQWSLSCEEALGELNLSMTP